MLTLLIGDINISDECREFYYATVVLCTHCGPMIPANTDHVLNDSSQLFMQPFLLTKTFHEDAPPPLPLLKMSLIDRPRKSLQVKYLWISKTKFSQVCKLQYTSKIMSTSMYNSLLPMAKTNTLPISHKTSG